ncbi:MAG: hypothetical protein WC476_12705, partial [Phycisphaerae bacterium]
MAITTYNCTALTGGGERSVDALPSTGESAVITGDRINCCVGGITYVFVYSSTGTDAENVATHPFIIRPDDYDAGGNWVEQAFGVIDPAAGTAGLRTLGTGAQQACAGNDSRLSNARPGDGTGSVAS